MDTLVHEPDRDNSVGAIKPGENDSWLDERILDEGDLQASICKSLYDGYNEFFISIETTTDFSDAKLKCENDLGGKLKNIQDYNSQALVQHNLALR